MIRLFRSAKIVNKFESDFTIISNAISTSRKIRTMIETKGNFGQSHLAVGNETDDKDIMSTLRTIKIEDLFDLPKVSD